MVTRHVYWCAGSAEASPQRFLCNVHIQTCSECLQSLCMTTKCQYNIQTLNIQQSCDLYPVTPAQIQQTPQATAVQSCYSCNLQRSASLHAINIYNPHAREKTHDNRRIHQPQLSSLSCECLHHARRFQSVPLFATHAGVGHCPTALARWCTDNQGLPHSAVVIGEHHVNY